MRKISDHSRCEVLDQPVISTDPKTGLPLIECQHEAFPPNASTPERFHDILLAQEVAWFQSLAKPGKS
jgi:hypothetical protein